MNVTRKLNLPLATLHDRIRQITYLADIRCFLMGSETGSPCDYQGSVRVSLENLGIRLYELKDALLGIEASHKKDGLGLTNLLSGKEQLSVASIEYDFGFSGQG